MIEYLKVKVISLADEARTIRKEENKAKALGETRLLLGLMDHRKGVVRPEARAALLAYGFLRGVPYHKMEKRCKEEPDWKRVKRLASKFGDGWSNFLESSFKEWREEPPRREENSEQGQGASLGVERSPQEAEVAVCTAG